MNLLEINPLVTSRLAGTPYGCTAVVRTRRQSRDARRFPVPDGIAHVLSRYSSSESYANIRYTPYRLCVCMCIREKTISHDIVFFCFLRREFRVSSGVAAEYCRVDNKKPYRSSRMSCYKVITRTRLLARRFVCFKSIRNRIRINLQLSCEIVSRVSLIPQNVCEIVEGLSMKRIEVLSFYRVT